MTYHEHFAEGGDVDVSTLGALQEKRYELTLDLHVVPCVTTLVTPPDQETALDTVESIQSVDHARQHIPLLKMKNTL